MNWTQLISNKRFGLEDLHDLRKHDRTEFQRDYDRLIFRHRSAGCKTRLRFSRYREAFLCITDLHTVWKYHA